MLQQVNAGYSQQILKRNGKIASFSDNTQALQEQFTCSRSILACDTIYATYSQLGRKIQVVINALILVALKWYYKSTISVRHDEKHNNFDTCRKAINDFTNARTHHQCELLTPISFD